MTADELTRARLQVCHIVRELGAMLDQLEQAEEISRLASNDPALDLQARADAFVSASEAAITAEANLATLTDLCTTLAGQESGVVT